MTPSGLGVRLVGEDLLVPCIDGRERPYVSLDAAASTGALPVVAERVSDFLPSYSSVHRGAGWKSQLATAEYEEARPRRWPSPDGRGETTWPSSVATPPKPSTTSPTGSASNPTTSC